MDDADLKNALGLLGNLLHETLLLAANAAMGASEAGAMTPDRASACAASMRRIAARIDHEAGELLPGQLAPLLIALATILETEAGQREP